MLDDTVLKLLADEAKFHQNEQVKRDLIKKAHETDKAKWVELQKSETGYPHA